MTRQVGHISEFQLEDLFLLRRAEDFLEGVPERLLEHCSVGGIGENKDFLVRPDRLREMGTTSGQKYTDKDKTRHRPHWRGKRR